MEFFADLWLPILLTTVVLFFASFVAWMILPHHFADKKKLPNQDAVMDLVREQNIPPGNYMFPYCDTKVEQGSKEFQDTYAKGPRGCLDVYEIPNIGKNMALTVVFFFVTTVGIAYITHFVCPPGGEGVDFMRVFRVAGVIGVLTHASSGVLNGIWFKRRQITDTIDGVVFGLLLGLIFAAMWPMG